MGPGQGGPADHNRYNKAAKKLGNNTVMVCKRAFVSPKKDEILRDIKKRACSELKKPKKCVLGGLAGSAFEHRPKVFSPLLRCPILSKRAHLCSEKKTQNLTKLGNLVRLEFDTAYINSISLKLPSLSPRKIERWGLRFFEGDGDCWGFFILQIILSKKKGDGTI